MSALEDAFAFQLRVSDLPEPEREYKFAKSMKRQWRFDFAFVEHKLAVELEGGIFNSHRSGHSSITGIKRDIEKGNAATMLGWRVLRFHTDHVKDGIALQMTEQALRGGL
jgi:very-short-patch-repair endonuclease